LAALRQTALDLGLQIARKLLGQIPESVRAQADFALIAPKIGGLSGSERENLARQVDRQNPLVVATALPLSEQIAETWRAGLRQAFGDQVAVSFSVDPELLAGAELHFPRTVLRASWRNSLALMRAEVERDDAP
jgi:F-type H+-transporting ATPase subunit b